MRRHRLGILSHKCQVVQTACAQFGKFGIKVFACLAEVGIGGIAKTQDGKGQFAEVGFLFAVDEFVQG